MEKMVAFFVFSLWMKVESIKKSFIFFLNDQSRSNHKLSKNEKEKLASAL